MLKSLRVALSIAMVLSLVVGVQALQMIPPGSIGGQWPFDRLVGATTPSVSGGAGAATLVAGPGLVAGLAGNGLLFNGTSQYLTVPNSTGVDVAAGDFTVAVWVNPSDTTPGRVLNKWDGSKGWLFDVHTGLSGGAAVGALRVRLNDGTNDRDITVAGDVVAGSWQHVAMTVDRAADVVRFYRNGVLKGGDQSITALTGNLTNTALLGMATIPASTGNFYAGTLDEPVLYKRVLTLPEILSLATFPPAAPASLTPTNGQNQVALAWLPVAGAASYNVLRSGTTGGPVADPYVIIASGITTLSYVDTTALHPFTYFYVVQAVEGATPSANSPQAVGLPLPIPVTALPNTGLQTNEDGTTTSFRVMFNVAAPALGSTVTVTSTNPLEGMVSTLASPVPSASLSFTVGSGFTGYVQVTVTGRPDVLLDGNVTYPITVTATNMGVTIPDVLVTNHDTNVAGITFSATSGLTTSESGSPDTFSATLNTRPNGDIVLNLSSSNTLEMTVSPASITFTPSGHATYNPVTGVGDWNVTHVVTVTGVDDSVLDFTIPFTVVTGNLQPQSLPADSAYTFNPADVGGVNIDNEVIPTLPEVWGGGGGGGCGLLGLEVVLLLGLAALRRR